MNLWIDTSALERAQALFGLPPLERLRRSAAKASEGAQVVLSGPGASPVGWPGAEVDVDAAPLGARLRRALAAGIDLVAIDGANVIDPRLIGFLLRSGRPALAARGEGAGRAVALRLAPALADAIRPTPPTSAPSPTRCSPPAASPGRRAGLRPMSTSCAARCRTAARVADGDEKRLSGRCSGRTTRARPTC
jgi:hypothetical protein